MLHAAGRLPEAKRLEAHTKELKDKLAAQKAAALQGATVTAVTEVKAEPPVRKP
jgi:hypothetical protein